MKEFLKSFIRKKGVVHSVLSLIVIAIMVIRFLHKDYYTVFLCALTLLLFYIPAFIDRTFRIKLSPELHGIILLFIFSGSILGEIGSFYTYIPWWDTMLHTINGFLMAAIGFSMIDVLNNSPKFHFSLSPVFVVFVAFCFSMTIGVLWEFFEFGMDFFIKTDMQKDVFVSGISSVALNENGINDPVRYPEIQKTVVYLTTGEEFHTLGRGYLDIGLYDTMKDLLVNLIGAVVFSVIGYFYLLRRDKGMLASRFIPQMKTKEEIEQTEKESEQVREALKKRIRSKNKKH